MSMNIKFPEIFEPDITSVSDFVEKIKSFKDKIGHDDWRFFYRGDRYCAKVQSNFFRYGNIDDEAENFRKWLERRKDCVTNCYETEALFEQLALMQHYQSNTRLLDFSEDPKVALRFACGKTGDDCRKKVTIYNTDYISLKDPKRDSILSSFLELVKHKEGKADPNFFEKNREVLSKDYFVEMESDFPRIKRQKSLFLLMGNFPTVFWDGNDCPYDNEKKVKHELSPTIGRGENYEGYVGVLSISPDCVSSIRKELEQTTCYRMDYLMVEGKKNSF